MHVDQDAWVRHHREERKVSKKQAPGAETTPTLLVAGSMGVNVYILVVI